MARGAEKGLDVLIAADATLPPEHLRPRPGKPIHYFFTQSRQSLGEVVAGVKLPDDAAVERAVVAELTKQGFVRTDVGGPIPDIVILAVLGDSNFKNEIPPGNPWNDDELRGYLLAVPYRQTLAPLALIGRVPDNVEDLFCSGCESYPSRDHQVEQAQEAVLAEARRMRNRDPQRKRHAIKALVGATKVDRAVAARTLSSAEAERIAWAAFDDQYYISVSALEAKKRADGGRALLWRTVMLIDARKDFTQALPAMLAQGGPMFGTDVAVPGFVNTATTPAGKVEIGEAKVISEKDAPSPKGAKK